MERLTYDFCIAGNHCWQVKGADNLECSEVCKSRDDEGCNGCPIANAFDRLAAIEDILGDDYDLDRLKELVQADREGKCVVLPCKDWLETVFGEQEVFYGIDDDYEEEKIREITVRNEERFTWLNGYETVILNGRKENGLEWEFTPDEIGKTVFLTREEAEAALERMEGEEKMKTTTCKACGKPIVWIHTTKGKSMPCDAEPVAYKEVKGGKEKIVTPNGEVISCTFDAKPDDMTGIGYISHWSTCPQANSFRKR